MNANNLILGGTGKTGKRIAERLVRRNLPVTIGSRSASPAFDWGKPEAWPDVLKEVQQVYITFQPDLAVPEATGAIRNFVEAAKKANIQKLVLLSGRGEKEAQACENIVMDSGLDWVVLRASWFMQNFSESFLLDSILAGYVVLPKIKAKEPFVNTDDIADVAIAALTDNKFSNKIIELTGPELLSFEKAVSLISSALRRPITYEEVDMEEYVAMLRTNQIPEDFIWLVKYLFIEVLDGRNESISQDFEKALGRKPGTFADYVEKTRLTGVWKPLD